MTLYSWALGAVVGLGLLIGAFFYGRASGIDHQKAIYAKDAQKAVAAMLKAQNAIDTLNGRVADAQRDQSTETRVIHETATRIIERPVYRLVCVDSDGIGVLDRAASNANRTLAGEPLGSPSGASHDAP